MRPAVSTIASIDPYGLTVLIFKTERNPRRANEPLDPWKKAAECAVRRCKKKNILEEVFVIDVNRVSQVNDALKNIKDISSVVFIGHADYDAIYVGNGDEPGTNISTKRGANNVSPDTLDWRNLRKDASIEIWGCHAGQGNNSIAKAIARATGKPVTAPDSYLNFDESTGEPFMRWIRFGEWITVQPSQSQLPIFKNYK